MSGRIPKTLFTKMNTNIVVRNGTQGRPSGPITSITMPLRTNSTTDSIAFWSPRGTSWGRRNAARNRPTTIAPATIIRSETRFRQACPVKPRSVKGSPLPITQWVWKISVPGAWNPAGGRTKEPSRPGVAT